MHVLTQLGKISKQVANISNVNHGGCCVFAAAVAKQLQELKLVDDVRLRVGNPNSDDPYSVRFDEVRTNATDTTPHEWNGQGVEFGHVIVEFTYDGIVYHYDTSGIHGADTEDPSFNFTLYADALTIEEATLLASVGQWNTSFDRKHIPKIHQIVNSLTKVDQ